VLDMQKGLQCVRNGDVSTLHFTFALQYESGIISVIFSICTVGSLCSPSLHFDCYEHEVKMERVSKSKSKYTVQLLILRPFL